MDFKFDWNCISSGAPYVTVSELGFAFNGPAISMLGTPDEVVIGFDEHNMAIGVKDAHDMKNAKTYKFGSRINSGWVRIGCRDFVKYLSSLSGISFSPAKKYLAQFDREKQILFITINNGGGEEDTKTE